MNLSTKKLGDYSLRLLYFSRFLTTTVPAQAALSLVCLGRPIILPARVYIYLVLVASYWLSVFSLGYSVFQLQNLLFYFSFIPPLLVLFSMKSKITPIFITKSFITIIVVLTVAEALLINSPLGSYLSFLYRDENMAAFTEFMGFYKRPMGISGNASMTSCVLIFSMVLSDSMNKLLPNDSTKRDETNAFFTHTTYGVTVAILVLASGTGFALLLLYFFSKLLSQIKPSKKHLKRMVGVAIVIAFTIYGSLQSENAEDFNKFSLTYGELIYDMKSNDVMNNIEGQNRNVSSVLFGTQVDQDTTSSATSGDFGFITMYGALGVLGSILVLFAPFLFITSLWKFIVPTFFFYVSFGHYAGLLSPPGAVLFSTYIYQLYCYNQVARRPKRSNCVS